MNEEACTGPAHIYPTYCLLGLLAQFRFGALCDDEQSTGSVYWAYFAFQVLYMTLEFRLFSFAANKIKIKIKYKFIPVYLISERALCNQGLSFSLTSIQALCNQF